MRKMTNSAGRTGAMPISQISRPFRMSSCDIVVRSQVMKNASSSVRPKSAPPRHCDTQEQADGVLHTRPQPVVVGLEDDPLRTLVNRALEEDEQPAHRDVLP